MSVPKQSQDRMLKVLELMPWQPRDWPVSTPNAAHEAIDETTLVSQPSGVNQVVGAVHGAVDRVALAAPASPFADREAVALPEPDVQATASMSTAPALRVMGLALTESAEPQAAPAIRSPDLTAMDWPALRDSVAQCTRCSLSERRTQTVFGVGDTSATWMLIGEAPGEQEDLRGEPFVGPAGKLLDNMLAALKLSRSQDVYIANVLKCRPPGNRNPLPAEIAACDGYLQRQIQLVRPKILLLVGKFAAQTVLHSDRTVGELRNRVHQVGSAIGTIPAVVTYHPSYLLRTPQEKGKAWSDLMLALRTLHNRAV